MSDFLNQFEKNIYKGPDNIQSSIINQNTQSVYSNKGIESVEHETVIDTKYNKNKTIRYIVTCITVIILAIFGFAIYKMLNRVTVKNLVGISINEAKTWGLKNNIEFDIEYVFNIEYNNDVIISQGQEANTKIQKGSIIYICVSKGPDQNEKLILPQFSEMDVVTIRNWIDANKAYNISVIQEYNDDIEANRFIKMEFRDTLIDESNYTRKDSLIVYVSKGKKAHELVSVPNFKDKPKSEVDTWAQTNGIEIIYEEKGSDKVPADSVISQDVEIGTKISKTDKITIELSVGKGISIPDFNTIPKQEATSYDSELIVKTKSRYSETVAYGKVISQSVKKGEILYGDNKKIEIIYSEGRPFIDKLVGRSEKELAAYFYDFLTYGANITYEVKYIDSYEEKGTVVWSSKSSEFIKMNEKIMVHVSRGNLSRPNMPDIVEE